ncbi:MULTISPECIES: carbonic anhydrase [Maricaulis]|uniref:Carbonic anhydrase n=1 Tax=Maricaulis maris (strain MCS10) TaxID=394221 RepID=Q0AL57_MARMM|nr:MULTISPECIES: carbonic anhydrase [Maricaulis]ABI66986.1 Carbonate dehydratase [Maricaulis maris MCS10]MAC89850.1 carbonic anhydrase [Maricaulis sp.]
MIDDLLRNNADWAMRKTQDDPDFFRRLSAQQHPEYLWVGCSDSRVPANDIVGLDPGELFVHRNIANLAPAQDTNFLSVLQFAVETLKVRHVIVCGHYGCGGVAAAVSGDRHGLIDHWLQPIRDTSDELAGHLLRIRDPKKRLDALCEGNVAMQVRSIACNPIIADAWRRGQGVAIHGWIYAIENGLVRDLGVTVRGLQDVSHHFPNSLSVWLGTDASPELQACCQTLPG